MRWAKKISTSIVVINLTLVVTYLLANLLLAFSQELFRVYGLFKETNNVEALMEFRQSYLTAFEYQQDYQLYYVSVGILAGIGLVSGVVKIFTEMYPPKPNFRKRVEKRKEYSKSVREAELVEGEKLKGETIQNEKNIELISDEKQEVSEEVLKDDEVEREAIIQGILKEAEERKQLNRETHEVTNVENSEFSEDDFRGFELERSSPDSSFERIINGDKDNADFKKEKMT